MSLDISVQIEDKVLEKGLCFFEGYGKIYE